MPSTMRAFVILEPGRGEVQHIERPIAGPGEVVVDVERAGLCGTDLEFFSGNMEYLATGEATYPIRIGHEWCGVVANVGDGVDPAWARRRVIGDTMLGCGRCVRCRSGRQHLCEERFEVGIRRGWPGALAEQLRVPASSLRAIPEALDTATSALIEPAGNAWRAADAAGLAAGERLLVIGAGAIGLLAGMIARAGGAGVTIAGRSESSIVFARSLGFDALASADLPADAAFDAVIDASTDPTSPSVAVDHVEPGRRVVYIGIAEEPSLIDTRRLVLKDVNAVGILSGSLGLDGAIELLGSGAFDPRPLVAAVVGLDGVAAALGGSRPTGAGPGPKIHVDPRLT